MGKARRLNSEQSPVTQNQRGGRFFLYPWPGLRGSIAGIDASALMPGPSGSMLVMPPAFGFRLSESHVEIRRLAGRLGLRRSGAGTGERPYQAAAALGRRSRPDRVGNGHQRQSASEGGHCRYRPRFFRFSGTRAGRDEQRVQKGPESRRRRETWPISLRPGCSANFLLCCNCSLTTVNNSANS